MDLNLIAVCNAGKLSPRRYRTGMKRMRFWLPALVVTCIVTAVMGAEEREQTKTPAFDSELVKRLGADERGMKMYVLCILKTGPKDAAIKGKERRHEEHATGKHARPSSDDDGSGPAHQLHPGVEGLLRQKTRRRQEHNQAVRAFGRHLIRVMWSMIKNQRDYIQKD